MSNLHELKTDVGPFQDVWSTRKTFDLRKDDRQFQVNDVLRLREYVSVMQGPKYTGREILVLVIHMLRGGAYGLPDGYVIMSLKLLARLGHPFADVQPVGM